MNKEELRHSLQSFLNNNEYKNAINYLSDLAETDDREIKIEALYQLGKIQYFENELDLAKEYFYKILSIDPAHFYSKIFLAKIYEKENKITSSIKFLRQAYNENLSHKQIVYSINSLVDKLEFDDQNAKSFVETKYEDFTYKNDFPKISIVILCHNKVEYTEKCLAALFKNTKYPNYEVIVLDNASVDDTPGLLESYGTSIKFLHSKENLGFVGGNNFAVDFAEGEYIVFLNNDTEPQENWLINLHKTFIYHNDCGAAGSMLIYPDGKLQEAGGVIFSDATGWNYGRNMSIQDSRFTYCREVDYCSGASLMIRRDLFFILGKFDIQFAPAYYEDTDLCFSVRKAGYKVYFNPFSKVIHHEGATAGTDLNSGFKKFQVINHPKFINKWKDELKYQYPNDEKLHYLFSDRNKGKRILIIDDIPPLPDRAAGALRHYHTLIQMIELGYKITYVHLMGKQYTDEAGIKYLSDFKMKGVEFIWLNYEYWWSFRKTEQAKDYIKTLIDSLDLRKRHFDFVYISFWYIAEYFVDLIKSQIPDVPILIDTMDLHYLRELRQAEISKDKKLLSTALENKKLELNVYLKADCVTTVTLKDRDELLKEIDKPVFVLTDVHEINETIPDFDERKDIVFVGNFNHNPNEDAVLYFVKEILPIVKSKIPEIKFYIVGNNPTEKIKSLASKDIIVTGWVPDVKEYLNKCRLEIVPLRFGAGNKGKVGEALANGIPLVTTTIGAEGMGIVNEEHAFVSDDPKTFGDYIVKLYNDKAIWNNFSVKGKELVKSQYSSELMRKRLKYIFSYNKRTLKSYQAKNYPEPPLVSIILIAFNQFYYTLKCLNSIKEKVKVSHEIILIDNASSDKTKTAFDTEINFVRYFRNEVNLGFPAAVNQGITKALGKFILVLNNDTILTDNLVERMLEIAESDEKIGLVGPLSNEVSGLQKDDNAKYQSIEEMHKYAERLRETNKNELLYFPRLAFLCTLIKREVIEKIGGLDERFSPGNYEDDDFCLRAQLAGFKTVIAKDTFIHHFGSRSFKADGNKVYQDRLDKNRKIFYNKWNVTPEDVWLKNMPIKTRQYYYPIEIDKFSQSFNRIKFHLADNEIDLAIQELNSALENYHQSNSKNLTYDKLLELAGDIYSAANQIDKAQEYYENLLKMFPNSSNACFGLAKCLLINDNIEAAKVMLQYAVKLDSNNLKAVELLEKLNNS